MTSEFAIGVHALVYLNHKQEILSSESLAENVCTNPARIRKVMSKLKKHDLVDTKEGIGGGYQLAKDGEIITLRQVAQALDERMIKAGWKSGDPTMDCLVSSGMSRIMDMMYEEMNMMCSDYLETVTVEDICEIIFGDEKNEQEKTIL